MFVAPNIRVRLISLTHNTHFIHQFKLSSMVTRSKIPWKHTKHQHYHLLEQEAGSGK